MTCNIVDHVTDDGNDRDELLRQFETTISGLELDDLRKLAGEVGRLSLGGFSDRPERPNLRRPRRTELAIYRLRIDLDQARPPIWRRLDVRSDVTLDVLHQSLQTAFGWTDSHLHRYSLGGGPFDHESELFLCPYDVEEGEDDGMPASDVRLDEVVQEAGDLLRYIYDYGDSWELTLRLEEVLSAADDSPTAICIDGRRTAPPEDCGGITDADDLAQVVDDPAHFDVDEVNQSLRDPYFVLRESGLHPRLVDLAHRLTFTEVGDDLVARLLSLTQPAQEPSPENKSAALRAYLWFLDRAGGEGIELTSAGYLKPADVEAASAVVPAMREWIGKNNREINCAPLLDFRLSLQKIGLLRKYKGRLLLTRAGARARRNPDTLWDHLATRLIPASKNAFAEDASLLILAYVATSHNESVPLDRVAQALGILGWRLADQRLIEAHDLYHFEHSPMETLRNVSDKPTNFRERDRLTPNAVVLAHAALHLSRD